LQKQKPLQVRDHFGSLSEYQGFVVDSNHSIVIFL
jgi:hypothetical protein